MKTPAKKTAVKRERIIPEPKFDDSIFDSPKEYHTNPSYAKAKDIKELIKLIDSNASETQLDHYLAKHPELLTFVIAQYRTGHHRSWVIPKRIIKTKFYKGEKGMIPDYILGGESTSGKEWFILELKGANHKWFTEKQGEIFFSDVINKGIHQLVEYQGYCDKYQTKFRDEYKLTDFHAPKAILIAGRRSEFEGHERKKMIKKTWEKLLGKGLEIMTYDRLKNQLELRLKDFKLDKERKKNPIFDPFNRPSTRKNKNS